MFQAQITSLTLLYLATSLPTIVWTLGIIVLVQSPVTITGNGFVLASILCDPFHNIRRTPSTYIIFNLAIADLLVGVVLQPLFAISAFYSAINNTEPFFDVVLESITFILLGVSFCSLIYLSVDRLKATATPLQYSGTVSKTKIRNVNISMWIYFTILAVCHSGFKTINRIWYSVIVAHIVIIAVVLFVLNIALVLSVRAQGKKIKRIVDSENSAVIQNAFNRERAVTRTTGVMVLAFLVCILPSAIFSFIYLSFYEVKTKLLEMISCLYYSGITLMYLNSLMNPFLYAWRLPKYRKAFQYIFKYIKNRTSISIFQSQSSRCAEQNENEHIARHCNISRTNVTCSDKIPQTHCHSKENGFREHADKEENVIIEVTKL